MSLRLPVALAAIAVGLVGLALNFAGISGTMVASAANPEPRSFAGFLVFYWSFLTNLSNTALLLVYIADLTGARGLGWFRHPVTKTGLAGIMMLVMTFYHFMLQPTLPPDIPQTIHVSNVLLHYATPILFLLWWAAFSGHGTLRYRDVPMMLVPGLLYVLYIQLRGPLVGEYPYTILDPGYAPPGGAAGGFLGVGISVAVLVVLVALFDLLLVFADGLMARRKS